MKQRFSKRTRLVSVLLTLAMVFTFLPFSAFAANTASTGIAFNSPDFKLNFPDEEFRSFLINHCDTNKDGKLDVDIKSMTIPTSYAIKNLEGIRFFEDLEKLDCHGIGLTTLNVGKNFKLEELDCSGNQLKEYYPILSSGLKKLNCSHNKLTYMNLGILHGLNLEEVNCSNNEIRNIVMDSVGELVKFDCSNNDLMTLDVSQCSKLQELNCSGNQLMELNVNNQGQLTELDCHNNKLTELNVKQNGSLTSLICNDNQLTTLDLSQNHSLSNLNCANNQLTQLNLNNMSALKELNCANNQLPQLNLNNMISLKELKCQNNQLTALDVSSSPNLATLVLKNNHLTSLNLDNNPHLDFSITDVYHSDFNNVYTVTLNPDRTFDLSTLPRGFEISRVTEWFNGTVKGNILTVNEGTKVVYYGYQCITGGIMDASFTLDVTGTGGSTGGGSTGGGTVTPPEPPVTPPSGGGSTGGSGGGDGGAGIAVLAIGGVAVAGLVGYGVYSYVSEQQLKALLPEGVAVPENRAQTALLLWNTAGRPEPAAQPAFPDVADPDTAKAAQWCVEQGLMNLKFRGRFAPDGSSPAYKTLNAYRQLVG